MDAADWVMLIKEVGFPAAVSVFCLSVCGGLAWSMHTFLTKKLVQVIEDASSAIQSGADKDEQVAAALERLSQRIEDCPQRMHNRWPQAPPPDKGREVVLPFEHQVVDQKPA